MRREAWERLGSQTWGALRSSQCVGGGAWPSAERGCRPHLTPKKAAKEAPGFATPQRTLGFELGWLSRAGRARGQQGWARWAGGVEANLCSSRGEGKPGQARGSPEV